MRAEYAALTDYPSRYRPWEYKAHSPTNEGIVLVGLIDDLGRADSESNHTSVYIGRIRNSAKWLFSRSWQSHCDSVWGSGNSKIGCD